MPQRSAVSQLPEEVRAELERRLVARSFAGYDELSEWLAEQGYQISKSALHRHGQKFEERLQSLKVATEQARALVAAAPDDEGAVSDALIRLVQEKLFAILVDLDVEQIDKINLGSLTRGISQLARASVRQKEWMAEFRQKVADRMAALEAEAAGGKGKLDPDTLRRVREEIYGIVA